MRRLLLVLLAAFSIGWRSPWLEGANPLVGYDPPTFQVRLREDLRIPPEEYRRIAAEALCLHIALAESLGIEGFRLPMPVTLHQPARPSGRYEPRQVWTGVITHCGEAP